MTKPKDRIPLESVAEALLPRGHKLLQGVNWIYELELALAEYHSLSKRELIRRAAYFHKVGGKETLHYALCTGAPLKIDKSTSARLRSFFQAYQFKTGYATHGLFPYRGKFHPQLIKSIMNIIKLRQGDRVLDNMTGSGTTNVEASVIGMDSIGVDASPFCCLMAQAKVDALGFDPRILTDFAKKPNDIFEHFHGKDPSSLSNYIDTGKDYDFSEKPSYENFLKLCYLDAMGYSRRRKKKGIEELFPQILDKYLSAVTNFATIRDKVGLKIGDAIIAQGDARDLNAIHSDRIDGIMDKSIDGIITSPPYSFAIDYLEGDRLQLEYMGYNVEELKEKMIGLRGQKAIEKVANYLKDMSETISEMGRVLRKGRYCAIVIGSNVNQLQRILETENNEHTLKLDFLDNNGRLEDAILRISEKHGLKLMKRFSRPIEGVQNIMRSEEILILKKK